MNDISKSDWKLYRQLLPQWQERYMKKLNQEYIQILRSDDLASANFWRLEKRIKADRRSPGVICEVSRRSMLTILVQLLGQQVITQADLVDFGPELRAQVDDLSNLYN
ncbi:hypothetical protein HMPREF0494_2197 [Limosilactobacillus antri DSM 16041]|uniref:Multidrug transporter n=2 Tax=Limosilactobacillus antri TaxID=227943 RepID=C8PA53_9LACO|nr:hypothetical protein HMPREF0494_2197 [Limosilactobacillus antri DSM 16041]KRK56956.1 hypothetical protein FC31_GL001076 [Limosilactobacillus antri DSM 16041]